MWTQVGLLFVGALGSQKNLDPALRDVQDMRRSDGVQGLERLLPACLQGAEDCQSGLHAKGHLGRRIQGNRVHR